MDKSYPKAKELISRGVGVGVAKALAPYQRGGVEFILDKEGRALLADEMGLGKTVQAIAAMSAYRHEWPLLVLCPSTARYHWEIEFRHWLGKTSLAKGSDDINVLTSGKDYILRYDGTTKVVICSLGLIVALVNNERIYPGMFKCVIVDESHALKNKSSKRTQSVVPLLKAADRCLLLSGTPALARPSELWPQLSVLSDDFYAKYTRGEKGEPDSGTRARWVSCSSYADASFWLAELHTLLTSTVMIRRMKADILKNLPSKIREKAFISVMGRLAREHTVADSSLGLGPQYNEQGEEIKSKEVLHHLYNITGRSKIDKVTKMLKSWLADPTKGKLCIFAHHLDVLNAITRGAGLSNFVGSNTRFIRIDGATNPKTRQEQILTFQTDPTVRIAMLGITAAGVAVTLTASSTVWFAELFWTPAIMIQAEDRCHRIGQQARVRCLYFVAKSTLDEVLWKLIEKKFRDLGE
ncbi:THAPSDRAFT_262487, partial [Thalassiosira pseudonana CCMP1335]